MMKKNLELCLQLFAEDAGGDTAQFTGETEAAAASQAPGEIQASAAGMQPNLDTEFAELIKGKYKSAFDARLQDTLKKRLRGYKEMTERMEALDPVLKTLSQRYGVQADDIAGLRQALAAEESTSQTPELTDAQVSKWAQEAAQVQKLYPGFDLKTELQDPRFARLLQGGADMGAAYEVLHRDRILPQAMHYTAKLVEKKLSDKLRTAQARPMENGTAGSAAAVVRPDVSQMSRQDRADIIRRVQKGERIRF